MSGIFGCMSWCGEAKAITQLDRMQRALPQLMGIENHRWLSPTLEFGVGFVIPSGCRMRQHGYLAESQDLVCLFDGVVHHDSATGKPDRREPFPAKFLLNEYALHGIDALRNVKGSFVVALWHKASQRLVLATDRVGHRHLFYAHDGKNTFFSSYLARIPDVLSSSPQLDIEGIADLLAFKHILGCRTLLKGIRLVPNGAAVVVNESGLNVAKYWDYSEVEVHGNYNKARLDQLSHTFETAVKRSFQEDRNSALALTGGLDSRAILAAASSQQIEFSTLTSGDPRGTDAVIAETLAKGVEVPHLLQEINAGELSDFLIPMVQYQSALSANIHSDPVGSIKLSRPYDALVLGITGETARSPWLTDHDLGIASPVRAYEVLLRAISSQTAKKFELSKLWNTDLAEIGASSPREHLKSIVESWRCSDSPLTAVDYFGLQEYTRKFLNKGVSIALARYDVAIPYIDHEWVAAILSVPLSDRLNNRIQIDLIRRLCPSLLKVKCANTLLPMTAGPRRVEANKRLMKFGSRTRKRWRHSPLPVHVSSFDYNGWSRKEMRAGLESLLMSKNAAYREFLNETIVGELLVRHFSGRQDWLHLVSALTVIEIAYRLWVTKEMTYPDFLIPQAA